MTLQEIARVLGGEVQGHQVRAPGPGHSPKDRSLAVMLLSRLKNASRSERNSPRCALAAQVALARDSILTCASTAREVSKYHISAENSTGSA